jgi:hypothetical protein
MAKQNTPTAKTPWACPNCGAGANERGRADARPMNGMDREAREHTGSCDGLLCDCADEGTRGHGESFENPCLEANCYYCGWGGSMPVRPKKLPAWAKKALDAGFNPPSGWTP